MEQIQNLNSGFFVANTCAVCKHSKIPKNVDQTSLHCFNFPVSKEQPYTVVRSGDWCSEFEQNSGR